MRASAVRYLSTCGLVHLLAAAFWQKTIQIWSLDQRQQIGQFDTSMTDGSNQLHLDPKGERGIVAGWRSGANGGVACYEIPTGRIAWHRTDLRRTQGLLYSPDGRTAWFEPNEGRVQRLDAFTGKTIDKLTGVKHLHCSEYSTQVLIEKRTGGYILRGERDLAIPKLTFAILDVTFGPESLCLTEATGPVRCIDCHTGSELWRHEPETNSHVLRLWYREFDKNYYGTLWQYATGGPRKLLRFDGRSGQVTEVCQFQSWEEETCPGLDCLILSSGEILGLSDGKLLGRLEFPQIDYPDR